MLRHSSHRDVPVGIAVVLVLLLLSSCATVYSLTKSAARQHDRGRALLKKGKYASAERAFTRSLDDLFEAVRMGGGGLLEYDGGLSFRATERAIKCSARTQRGIARYRQQKFPEALRDFKAVLYKEKPFKTYCDSRYTSIASDYQVRAAREIDQRRK